MRRTIWPSGVLGAVLAVLAAAPAARAEPIRWSYQSTIAGETGAPFIDMGIDQMPPSQDGDVWVDVRMIGSVEKQEQSGEVEGAFRDRIGGLGYTDVDSFNESLHQTVDALFRVLITITDQASGESGTVSFTGVGRSMGHFTTGTGTVSMHIQGEADLWLGGNHYRVQVVNEPSETSDHIVADVQVREAAQTPEPASLGLLGLAGVGAVVMRVMRCRRA
jgi:hypothetical protein